MGADLIDYDMRIEDAFDIRIPDGDAVELMTVGQMHDYLVRRLPQTSPEELWDRQLDVLCRFLHYDDVRRNEIKPEHHFVRDLGFS
jgi:acyl carrier protein